MAGLTKQRKAAKRTKKKVEVVPVTADMVAVSEKHAAELLEMFGEERVVSGDSSSSSKSKKSPSESKKKKGKRQK